MEEMLWWRYCWVVEKFGSCEVYGEGREGFKKVEHL
jgi:hypothetical protein